MRRGWQEAGPVLRTQPLQLVVLACRWVFAAYSYSGLVPAVYQTGDKDARGPLTTTGSKWLRYAPVLAAQPTAQLRHPDPRLERTFISVAFRHGRNPAKVAAARRLLDLIYYLLEKGQDYRAPRPRATATA